MFPRHVPIVLALLASTMVAGCGRTPAFAGAGTTGGASSGGTCPGLDCGMTTAASTGSTGSSTGGDTTSATAGVFDLPPAPTCRDALDCILGCLLAGDLACTQGCIGDLPPDEAQAAAALMGCIVGVCVSNGDCDPLNLNQDCFMCIGIRLVAPEPTGCEAEAMACQ